MQPEVPVNAGKGGKMFFFCVVVWRVPPRKKERRRRKRSRQNGGEEEEVVVEAGAELMKRSNELGGVKLLGHSTSLEIQNPSFLSKRTPMLPNFDLEKSLFFFLALKSLDLKIPTSQDPTQIWCRRRRRGTDIQKKGNPLTPSRDVDRTLLFGLGVGRRVCSALPPSIRARVSYLFSPSPTNQHHVQRRFFAPSPASLYNVDESGGATEGRRRRWPKAGGGSREEKKKGRKLDNKLASKD